MARITNIGGGSGYRFLTPISRDWWSGARISMLLIIVNFAFWVIYVICEQIWSRGGFGNLAGELGGSAIPFANVLSPYIAISAEYTFQKLRLWTMITYMFAHYDFMHFFWNNLLLLFFAPQIERDFGVRKFIIFYLTCGVGAAIISILYKTFAHVMNPTIGASGAVMGILVAYGLSYPNQTVYVFGMFPVKMKTLLIVIVIIQIAMTLQPGGMACTDYWAHIGGLVTGFLFMKLPSLTGRGPRRRRRNWRGEDDGPERSYYLEI